MEIIDTTLRDGEQAPGVCFSLQEKLRICAALERVGIREIEINNPIVSREDSGHIREILSANFAFAHLVWCRCALPDLKEALRAGVRRIHMAFPVSDAQLKIIGASWENFREKLHPLLKFARENFEFVSVGIQDASRAAAERVLEFAAYLSEEQVHRVRVSDTLGLFHPIQVWDLLQRLNQYVPRLPLEYHGHNDMGMATANAFIAMQAGASVSATVLGIGERAGNASLEQLVLAAAYHQLTSQYHSEHLYPLCDLVQKILRLPVPKFQPIFGENIFVHESGIHIHGLIQDPYSFSPLQPEDIGAPKHHRFVFGKYSGRAALRFILRKNQINTIEEPQLDVLLEKIKKQATFLKRSLDEKEVLDLVASSRSSE